MLAGPTVPAGSTVYERVIVTDTGTLAIDNATVSDASTTGGPFPAGFTFGGSGTVSLASGQQITSDVATVVAAPGHQIDTATVTGSVTDTVNTATVSASDSADYTGDSAPAFVSDSPPLTAAAGTSYGYTFSAGGFPPPTYSLASGAPSWLSIDPTTGVLSGTVPPGTTSFSYSVTATNAVSSTTAGPFTVTVASPVSLAFHGALTYANSGEISSGSLTVDPSSGTITSVNGTITIPGLHGGTARITVHIFRVFGIYLGEVTVQDPSAQLRTTSLVFTTDLTRTASGEVSGTAFGLSRLGLYTLVFTI